MANLASLYRIKDDGRRRRRWDLDAGVPACGAVRKLRKLRRLSCDVLSGSKACFRGLVQFFPLVRYINLHLVHLNAVNL